uniref:Dihydropyrimidinase like 5a n=1 Tax=Maylandia zebra TaxID=106582 RepID=A0A3P9CFE7_9CICH
ESFMNATTVDDFYSGTKAALAGGTTMVIGHVLPERNESLLEAYEKCRNSADSKACCDYALHIGVTWWGPKMEKLVRDKGVNSFQMFMAYKDMFMLRDSELFQVLQHCKDIGAIARVHAENGELVSEVRDLLGITVCAHCPVYLVNVSSMSAGDVVATAKMQGEALYLLYLVLLSLNDTLNVVGSDHRPFTVKQKAMGKDDFTKIPHGLPGIQDRMSVIWERGGKMDENRFVAVTSSNAAKIYNLYPRKGRIIPGADADVVVWDPEGSKRFKKNKPVFTYHICFCRGLVDKKLVKGSPSFHAPLVLHVPTTRSMPMEKVRRHTVQCALKVLSCTFPARCFPFPIPPCTFAAFFFLSLSEQTLLL